MQTIPTIISTREFNERTKSITVEDALIISFINTGSSTVVLDSQIRILPAPAGTQPVPFQMGVDFPYVINCSFKLAFEGAGSNGLLLLEIKPKGC